MTVTAVSINDKKLLIALILFELILFISFLVDSFLLNNVNIDVLNLDSESTIASWFSSLQYFCIALIFFQKSQQIQPSPVSSSLFLILSLGFVFLSIDESVSIHEKLNNALQQFESFPRFKGNHGIWISLYVALLLPLVAIMHRSLVHLWNDYRQPSLVMVTGAATLVFGAVFLEIIGYEYLKFDINDEYYILEVAFEELFEMAGVSIILYGALTTLRTQPVITTNPQFVVT